MCCTEILKFTASYLFNKQLYIGDLCANKHKAESSSIPKVILMNCFFLHWLTV